MTDLSAKVEAGDRDRWVTARLAGPLAPRLMAIYAFDLEIARIPLIVSEPLLGEMRLQFWRDAIAAIYEGGAVPGHEIAAPLAEVIAAADLPRAPFDALIEARRSDLTAEPHADWGVFDRYVAATHAGPMGLAARALGGGEATDAIAADLGHAAGVARMLARGAADAGSSPLPLDRDQGAEALRADVAELARDALTRLRRARGRRGDAPPATAPAFFAAWRAAPVLRRAADPGVDLGRGLASSDFAARAALMFRVMLGRW